MEEVPVPRQDDFTPEEEQLFEGNSWRLPSDIKFVAKAETVFTERLASVTSLDEDRIYELGLGFREIIINAIIHGNLRSAEKYVTVNLEIKPATLEVPGMLKIVVADEGKGFKIDEVPDSLNQEGLERPSGRGIFLARQYFDSVDYNKTGNEVTLIKTLESPAQERT